jgi:hypothetical protein
MRRFVTIKTMKRETRIMTPIAALMLLEETSDARFSMVTDTAQAAEIKLES